jgi:hypothetical protein
LGQGRVGLTLKSHGRNTLTLTTSLLGKHERQRLAASNQTDHTSVIGEIRA